jgi:membrane protein YqaA with SNARE-associated domain
MQFAGAGMAGIFVSAFVSAIFLPGRRSPSIVAGMAALQDGAVR